MSHDERLLALSRDGVSVARAADALGVSEAEAKRALSRLQSEGKLELDLEGDEIVYREKLSAAERRILVVPKEAAPKPVVKAKAKSGEIAKKPREGEDERDEEPEEKAEAKKKKEPSTGIIAKVKGTIAEVRRREAAPRSLLIGVGAGALVPGIGLVYAAPWKVAGLGVAGGVVMFWILSYLPFVIAGPLFAVLAVGSGVLGGLYAWKFNKEGKRAPLGDDAGKLKKKADTIRTIAAHLKDDDDD